MRLAVVSFKECWRAADGRWYSSGGFPHQMAALGSLFDGLDLLVVRVPPEAGGSPLPPDARVATMPRPVGIDWRRKLSVGARLPYYLLRIGAHVARADALHVPLPGDLPALALLMGVALRKPVLARYGGSWADNAQTSAADYATKALMRRLAGGRHVMFATGDGAAEPAPGMRWVFSTSLDRAELAGIAPEVDRGLNRPLRLVFFGRLAPEKGLDLLLRALARLPLAVPPHLTLVGDGPERPALTALRDALGIGAQITFAGQLDRAALSQVARGSDVCVQPSRTEGYSKAWLDAFAHGLPVLAGDVGAARAVVGTREERGWVVPPDDLHALTSTLHRVLTATRDWPALRRRCREYAESRTLDVWAAQIGRACAEQWNAPLARPVPA